MDALLTFTATTSASWIKILHGPDRWDTINRGPDGILGGANADEGTDYEPVSDFLTFMPGETEKTVVVKVHGDLDIEPDETFHLELSQPVNASLMESRGVGLILNDAGAPVRG